MRYALHTEGWSSWRHRVGLYQRGLSREDPSAWLHGNVIRNDNIAVRVDGPNQTHESSAATYVSSCSRLSNGDTVPDNLIEFKLRDLARAGEEKDHEISLGGGKKDT